MKRALILCLFLVFGKSFGYCATTYFPPLQAVGQVNPIQSYNQNDIVSSNDALSRQGGGLNYADLGRVEMALFGRAYPTQTIFKRLARIEQNLFARTYPNSSELQRIDNIMSNFNQLNKYPNVSRAVLSRIEAQILNQRFDQNSAQRRIERLEEQLFGAVQSGDINARYEAIKIAAKSYKNSNYEQSNNYYPNTIQQTGTKGLLGVLGGLGGLMGGGTMTGFTPPISPYNSYNNVYNSGYNNPFMRQPGFYRGNMVNRGLNGFSYNDGFSSYGSGTGVTILD